MKVQIRIVAWTFIVAAMIGAWHSYSKGYSEIYTGIFLLLAGGYFLITLIIDDRKAKNDEA